MSTNRRCNPACACADALRWLAANKHNLAPLTGTSTKALKAVAHLWQLYAYSRDEAVLHAIGLLVPSLGNCTGLARELAAWAMNWEDREKLWPMVVGNGVTAEEVSCKSDLLCNIHAYEVEHGLGGEETK